MPFIAGSPVLCLTVYNDSVKSEWVHCKWCDFVRRTDIVIKMARMDDVPLADDNYCRCLGRCRHRCHGNQVCRWIYIVRQNKISQRESRNIYNAIIIIVRYPEPGFRTVSIQALSSYDILSITKVIGLTAIMTWNIEEFRAYYNAMLHVNLKMMTSQQRWYLLLNYYFNNNKIDFLFSCEIRSWSLHFRQFDMCQVNTTQSDTLVRSIVPNKWAKVGAKIFRHFWDIAIFVLEYFILLHLVYYTVFQKKTSPFVF